MKGALSPLSHNRGFRSDKSPNFFCFSESYVCPDRASGKKVAQMHRTTPIPPNGKPRMPSIPGTTGNPNNPWLKQPGLLVLLSWFLTVKTKEARWPMGIQCFKAFWDTLSSSLLLRHFGVYFSVCASSLQNPTPNSEISEQTLHLHELQEPSKNCLPLGAPGLHL